MGFIVRFAPVSWFILGASLIFAVSPLRSDDLVLKDAPVTVRFSPHGGGEALVVETIDQARASIKVLAYSFTSSPIASALKRAHDRGVDVRVILDKSQRTERYSGLTYLRNSGISTWIDSAHSIAHNKTIVIDDLVTITGSFNFTKSAENSNGENILRIRDTGLAAAYRANWETHFQHADTE